MSVFKINFLIKAITTLFLFSILQSCSYFNTVAITPEQIEKQSSWNDLDQKPTFPECEEADQEKSFICFKYSLRQRIVENLSNNEFISLEQFDEEIVLEIQIDREGNFSLSGIEDEYEVINQIETLSSVLNEVISNLPPALPAVKTNVGVKVNTILKLPIRIVASPDK